MTLFALSCFGILLFLWLAFGGGIPLKAQAYRFTVAVPEANLLVQEADVRLAGVNIGKVKKKELDKDGTRSLVEVELQDKYAPIPRDTRAILRQKTLLGETYLELSPGSKQSGKLPEGSQLANGNVEAATELDEIFRVFNRPTRDAFRIWVGEGAKSLEGDYPQDLNDALGNLAPFATDASTLLRILDGQETNVHDLVRNTGHVFDALLRAKRPAARADRQRQRDLRGAGPARPGARRHVRDLPDLPHRDPRHRAAARELRAQHEPARERAQGPRRRPRPHAHRPPKALARPRRSTTSIR